MGGFDAEGSVVSVSCRIGEDAVWIVPVVADAPIVGGLTRLENNSRMRGLNRGRTPTRRGNCPGFTGSSLLSNFPVSITGDVVSAAPSATRRTYANGAAAPRASRLLSTMHDTLQARGKPYG